MSTHLHRNLSSKFMIVCSINSTTSQTALNLGRSKLVSIETNKINFDRKKIMMLMKFKLHQELTLSEHQKKFSHTKKLWYAWSITRRVLNLPGLRFGRASYNVTDFMWLVVLNVIWLDCWCDNMQHWCDMWHDTSIINIPCSLAAVGPQINPGETRPPHNMANFFLVKSLDKLGHP